ncbi:NAD(P)H-dependent glycerol-3-phosphate dehydrogenase [Limnoglobus roseus]|uniref:Glycerol-3-phosphate dehydrogenase [NAD(P)+] n=1 Tax=Limnoglobus roseus TaxID=2598579 RepID=A0A5C1AP08_9BACT|nr:NAD(P)H-dependent glycerol-3-phosphate dehydrogenase [Limnoglobus roseus]QEL18954.1 NAD(P)-dependent glycerol-3-phosphate dehydrogenase [Limnoglobus roseus]
MAERFAVLGAGAWGTAVAIHLAKLGHAVSLWAARGESAARLFAARENLPLLPGVPIPDKIAVTADSDEATRNTDNWIVAIPTAFLRPTLSRFIELATSRTRCLSLTKGIEVGSFLRPSEIIAETLAVKTVAALSGPSHAEEMARGLPTSVVVAGTDREFAATIQHAFGTARFRVYTNRDLIGLELGGALKNVLGIAAGICDGLGFGDNAKSALLTRSIVEMTRFGVALGAEAATFAGLAGIGDLMTTCFSRHGRNRRVGERLGRGEPLDAILAGPQVAEGVYTAKSVRQRSLALGLDVPIMSAVYDVLYEGKSPLAAVQDLMARQMREEG